MPMSANQDDAPEYPVRIFLDSDEYYEDLRDEYDASDFATLPAVGDIIVSPWALPDADRGDPEQRTFYEVVRRYFSPSSRKPVWVALVVKRRPGTEKECNVFNN